MPGLQILKNDLEKVAKEDDQYPGWLWSVLEPKSSVNDNSDQTFNALNERKILRKQHRADLKAKNFLKST